MSQPTWQQSLELTLAQQHASALIDIMKTSHNIHTLPDYQETGPPAVTHCMSQDEAIGLYCCNKQDKPMFQDSMSRDRATLIVSQLVCHVIRLLLYIVLKSKKDYITVTGQSVMRRDQLFCDTTCLSWNK